ncbi:MAG: DUF1549 domain-containing protein, partial [Planctomycetales bacterium]|nr:DUF1549 domain-containing protein [Planctomycetales bacterium]
MNKGLPSGWNLAAKADKDTYTVTCTVAPTAINRVAENRIAENRIAENEIAENDVAETAPAERLPQLLPLQVFAEFQGRGRVETISLPIEWIDPVDVTLELPEALIAGGPAMVQATVVREGSDPQPVTLAFTDLPAGWSVPEEVTVAADQSHAEFSLPIPADAPSSIALRLSASSQYQGQTFSVSSNVVRGQIQPSPQRIEAFPSSIVLSDPRARQQVLVSGYGHDDKPRDWTQAARLTSLDPNIVEVRGSVLFPLSDGSTELLVEVGSARQSIAVEVSGMNAPRPVAFETEVLVALSKQGCNSGACHGSPSGKGGFRLSLRAFDRQLDELTLIREDFGRRVNPLEAAKSLLLHKPLMKVAHGGGKQLHEEDVAYQILRNWIAEGARADPPDAPRCVRLQVTPGEKRVLPVSSGGQQLAVTAHFADGTQRDVTHLVAYETSNTDVATVDRSGFVSPQGRGEAAILVRYLEFIESLPLMFVEEHEDFRWQAPPANNYVDELVNAKLRQLQFLPAETCSDSEFLRRVYLDVIGILPTVTETREFLADTSSDKRARCIDRLVQRDEYAKFWALKWGDLLKMTGKLVGQEGVYKYHRWLEEALRSNMPYDRFAQQLLTASGSTLANPPANFYRTSSDMNECVETVSQVFLGARLQCAKCHNHPFERWTQANY